MRASHAKVSGVVTGELHVPNDLPLELRQGLFSRQGTYPAVVRFAQGPGEFVEDSVHRGMVIKLLWVEGERLEGHTEPTQDIVLATGPVSPILTRRVSSAA